MSQSDSSNSNTFTNLTRSQYVLRYGVLGWGVPTAVLFSIIQYYMDGGSLLVHLVPALILFLIGGIFFGRFMYRSLERKHAKAVATGAKQ